jgi:SAM-dependent methyltransferase
VFFDVHSDLPREGPGNAASTQRALAAILNAGADAADLVRVLDVACGPGQQTRDLAERLPGSVLVATDLHRRYLRQVAEPAPTHGGALIAPVCADMRRLPVAAGGVDLIWCEGAAYIMGIAQALAAWGALLRDGGWAAFTEPVWLRERIPEPVRACWEAYPAMGDAAACRQLIRESGLVPIADFVLPAEAWWDDYYAPMAARIEHLAPSYAGDPVACEVLDACRMEIDVYREHGDCYGYAFFVLQKPAA